MAGVALVALGLVWWPSLLLLSLLALVYYVVTNSGRAGFWDGLLAGIPLTLWFLHVAVILPSLQDRHTCDAFGEIMGFFFCSTVAMLACEVTALRRYHRGANPMLRIAVVLNWSWLYYVKVLLWGTTLGRL